MSGPKSDSFNRPSSCLKQYENDEIFSMIGRRCTVSCFARQALKSILDLQSVVVNWIGLILDVLPKLDFVLHHIWFFQTLATSVAQLYVASPESRNRWKKKLTGVICFVKDNGKRSYFLRMYSLVVCELLSMKSAPSISLLSFVIAQLNDHLILICCSHLF